MIPATRGRPRRLTDGAGSYATPLFSPDGRTVAVAGRDTGAWDADSHVFVVSADANSSTPERVAPQTDRPVLGFPGMPPPMCWTGADEVSMLIADRGAVGVHRARLGQPATREVFAGELQVDGFSARVGRRAFAFTASWPDRPGEVYTAARPGAEPAPVTSLNDELVAEVDLAPVTRTTVARADGTEVEYFTILPADGAARRRPLHLDIHGGPYAFWPSGRWIGLHQAIVAAGYALVLPNPRGSSSYGQEFTAACTGDWGGGDYEDILACCDDVIERGIADERRMFVSGGSYGGFMTSWIVGHTDRFRAASALAAVVDMTSMALTSDVPEFALFSLGGTPWKRADEYAAAPAPVPAGGQDPRACDPLGGGHPRSDRPGRGAVHRPQGARQGSRAAALSRRLSRRSNAVPGRRYDQADSRLQSPARSARAKLSPAHLRHCEPCHRNATKTYRSRS